MDDQHRQHQHQQHQHTGISNTTKKEAEVEIEVEMEEGSKCCNRNRDRDFDDCNNNEDNKVVVGVGNNNGDYKIYIEIEKINANEEANENKNKNADADADAEAEADDDENEDADVDADDDSNDLNDDYSLVDEPSYSSTMSTGNSFTASSSSSSSTSSVPGLVLNIDQVDELIKLRQDNIQLRSSLLRGLGKTLKLEDLPDCMKSNNDIPELLLEEPPSNNQMNQQEEDTEDTDSDSDDDDDVKDLPELLEDGLFNLNNIEEEELDNTDTDTDTDKDDEEYDDDEEEEEEEEDTGAADLEPDVDVIADDNGDANGDDIADANGDINANQMIIGGNGDGHDHDHDRVYLPRLTLPLPLPRRHHQYDYDYDFGGIVEMAFRDNLLRRAFDPHRDYYPMNPSSSSSSILSRSRRSRSISSRKLKTIIIPKKLPPCILLTTQKQSPLLSQIPLECLDRILQYASPNSLCGLDASCKHMYNSLTKPYWEQYTMKRFGIITNTNTNTTTTTTTNINSNSNDLNDQSQSQSQSQNDPKKSWSKGMSFTSPTRGLHYVFQLQPKDVRLFGSTTLSTHHSSNNSNNNNSTIVATSDNWDILPSAISNKEHYEGNCAIIFRDTNTLLQSIVRNPTDDMMLNNDDGDGAVNNNDNDNDNDNGRIRNITTNWFHPCLGGTKKREVVLLYDYETIFAIYQDNSNSKTRHPNDFYHEFDLNDLFPNESPHGIGNVTDDDNYQFNVIGSTSHFIILINGKLFILKFNPRKRLSIENNPIVPLICYNLLPLVNAHDPTIRSRDDIDNECIKWGNDNDTTDDGPRNKTFIVAISGKIIVLNLNEYTSDITQSYTIKTQPGIWYNDIVLSKQYIVACPDKTQELHLYSRNNSTGDNSDSGKLIAKRKISNIGRSIKPKLHIAYGEILVCTSYGDNDESECNNDSIGSSLFVWELLTRKTYNFPRMTNSASHISSMVQVNGGEYTMFVTHSYGSPIETVWAFPQSEQGLKNLERIVKRHTKIIGPPESESKPAATTIASADVIVKRVNKYGVAIYTTKASNQAS